MTLTTPRDSITGHHALVDAHAGGGTTADLLARARAHLPGGGIWTFSTRPAGFGTTLDAPDFLIERGEGAYVWTTDDERLMDLVLGSGTVLVGHAHPEVVAAVSMQVARGANYSHLSPPAVELADRICAVVPWRTGASPSILMRKRIGRPPGAGPMTRCRSRAPSAARS